jgi:hypothetical protein
MAFIEWPCKNKASMLPVQYNQQFAPILLISIPRHVFDSGRFENKSRQKYYLFATHQHIRTLPGRIGAGNHCCRTPQILSFSIQGLRRIANIYFVFQSFPELINVIGSEIKATGKKGSFKPGMCIWPGNHQLNIVFAQTCPSPFFANCFKLKTRDVGVKAYSFLKFIRPAVSTQQFHFDMNLFSY